MLRVTCARTGETVEATDVEILTDGALVVRAVEDPGERRRIDADGAFRVEGELVVGLCKFGLEDPVVLYDGDLVESMPNGYRVFDRGHKTSLTYGLMPYVLIQERNLLQLRAG